jgi:NADH dehydrogenase FAD-containing subunit
MHKPYVVASSVDIFAPPRYTRSSVRIADNFEMASLPSTSEEERKRLLSFVVCGGGPTGVETAAVRPHRPPTLVLSLTRLPGDLRSVPRRHYQLRES